MEDDVIKFQQIEEQPNPTGKNRRARSVEMQLLGVVGNGSQGKEGYILSRVCVWRSKKSMFVGEIAEDNGDRPCTSNLVTKRT